MYKLHGFSQSGNAYKVAGAAAGTAPPWTPVHMPFSDFAGRRAALGCLAAKRQCHGRSAHPRGGDKQLTQSAAIMLYLAEKHGAYGGQDEDERQEVMRWLFFDNHKFTSYFASWRFTKSFAPRWRRIRASRNGCAGRIDNAFGIAERHLAKRDYVVGLEAHHRRHVDVRLRVLSRRRRAVYEFRAASIRPSRAGASG
jgi:glutathione S-transferase